MSGDLEVTGGAAGLAASCAEARGLADGFDDTAERLGEVTLAGLATMRAPALLASTGLAPETGAAAEAALLALSGAVAGCAVGLRADAASVRVALAALVAADAAAAAAVGVLDRHLAAVALGQVALDPDGLSEHPGLTQHAVSGLGGALTTLLAGAAYAGPGRAVVTPYPASLPRRRPRRVEDLVRHLHAVADLSPTPHSAGNGTVEVQTISDADGRRHVVYLPGTDRFNAPWDQGHDARDLESGLDLAAGRPDAYTPGVLEALRRAGVRPDEPVLLVGHSLGGMAAAALTSRGRGFDFRGAVTAGSPTAQVPGYPSGTHVLSLEQRGDVVPELDGAPNRDTVEQTTVSFDADPERGVLEHHGYPAYEHGAALVDASGDPSVAEAVAAFGADGFLGTAPADVTSQVFAITRDTGRFPGSWGG